MSRISFLPYVHHDLDRNNPDLTGYIIYTFTNEMRD